VELAGEYRFTGKERDPETGLDYFEARYNASAISRFITPDPLGGRLIDPQTLNKEPQSGQHPPVIFSAYQPCDTVNFSR
jgi:RHS repeat-associated protein